MSGYFKEIYDGTHSLAVGLGITAKYFCKPVVTRQYPYPEGVDKMPDRFRGHIELVKDEKTGSSKCIVCGMCQRACPLGCITVKGEKPEGAKRKVLTTYQLDFTKCSLCGLCVESCKPEAITFSKNYNLAGPRKEDFIFDLVKRLEEKN